jgi:hypothetical protein
MSRYARSRDREGHRVREGEAEEQEGLLRTGDAREEELERERRVEVGKVNAPGTGGSGDTPKVSASGP